MKTTSHDKAMTVPLRLPAEDLKFLDETAGEMCNTRAGVVRFAIAQLRKATEAAKAKATAEEPELAGAH